MTARLWMLAKEEADAKNVVELALLARQRDSAKQVLGLAVIKNESRKKTSEEKTGQPSDRRAINGGDRSRDLAGKRRASERAGTAENPSQMSRRHASFCNAHNLKPLAATTGAIIVERLRKLQRLFDSAVLEVGHTQGEEITYKQVRRLLGYLGNDASVVRLRSSGRKS